MGGLQQIIVNSQEQNVKIEKSTGCQSRPTSRPLSTPAEFHERDRLSRAQSAIGSAPPPLGWLLVGFLQKVNGTPPFQEGETCVHFVNFIFCKRAFRS